MAIYILRHGLSEGNVDGYFQGSLDTKLTELGRQQARATGRWLKAQGVQLTHAYASPLKRAWDTAELVLAELAGPEATATPELAEYYAGRLEGMQPEDLRNSNPAYYDRPLGERGDFSAWGGESYAEMQSRLQSFLDRFHQVHSEHDEVLLVSHGGALYQLLKLWCGWPAPRHYFTRISNCTCFQLKLRVINGENKAELNWMVPLALHAPELAEQR